MALLLLLQETGGQTLLRLYQFLSVGVGDEIRLLRLLMLSGVLNHFHL